MIIIIFFILNGLIILIVIILFLIYLLLKGYFSWNLLNCYFCFFSDKKTGTLALIIELLDMNLYEVIKGKNISCQ